MYNAETMESIRKANERWVKDIKPKPLTKFEKQRRADAFNQCNVRLGVTNLNSHRVLRG